MSIGCRTLNNSSPAGLSLGTFSGLTKGTRLVAVSSKSTILTTIVINSRSGRGIIRSRGWFARRFLNRLGRRKLRKRNLTWGVRRLLPHCLKLNLLLLRDHYYKGKKEKIISSYYQQKMII
jgi:hypothetical protein